MCRIHLAALFLLFSCAYHDLSEDPAPGSPEDPPKQNICEERTVSWQADVLPIIQQSCAISGCHNGISRTDLRRYELAKANASDIKAFTQDRSMPFEGTITQQQIDLIGCWVDAGAPQN